MSSGKKKALTVAQLIEKLKWLPQDLPVFADGCDCVGECVDVRVDTAYETEEVRKDYVLLARE